MGFLCLMLVIGIGEEIVLRRVLGEKQCVGGGEVERRRDLEARFGILRKPNDELCDPTRPSNES